MCHYRSSTNNKARGVYIGGPEVSCGNGPSYFADLASASSSFLNNLRTGSQTNSATVSSNYCKPSENLGGNFNQSWTFDVSGSITSTQNILNGNVVRYEAGTYIELNPGFVSGTDFIAEIKPCVSTVTVIAAKTDDEVPFNQEGEAFQEKHEENWLKIYPTIVLSGNAITIEANVIVDGVEFKLFDMQGRHIRSFRLNGFIPNSFATVQLDVPAGLSLLKHNNKVQNYLLKKM